MDKKTCFVVSAIGEENSDVRKHSDSVLNHIIKPALSDEYIVNRADELYHSDRIDDQIFEALTNSELVVVDITGNNPNVFLELGYRKALNLPTIFLRQKADTAIPFDIRSINIIHYDLKSTDSQTVLSSVQETVQRIRKTEKSISPTHITPNAEKSNISNQEFNQLKATINNIYDAIETLSEKLEDKVASNRPMTQEDLIMMAFKEPDKLEKIFELQAKYPNAFKDNSTE